jgi:hypothetical protein
MDACQLFSQRLRKELCQDQDLLGWHRHWFWVSLSF